MAEGSVWQLHGGLRLSSPGSPGKWSEALRSATATGIKKLILIQFCVLLLAHLLITLTLCEEHVDTKYSQVTFKHTYLKEFCHVQHSYISKVTYFWPILWAIVTPIYQNPCKKLYSHIYNIRERDLFLYTDV